MTTLLASFIPIVGVFYLVYKQKEKRKKTIKNIIKTFLIGGLAGIFSFVSANFLMLIFLRNTNILNPNFSNLFEVIQLSIISAVSEGIFKFLAISIFVYSAYYKISKFTKKTERMLYAIFIGIGIVFFWFIFYFFRTGFLKAFYRFMVVSPFFIFLTILMGYFIEKANEFFKNKNKTLLFLFFALFFPILFHIFHEVLIFNFQNNIFSIFLFLIDVFLAILGIVFLLIIFAKEKNQIKT